MGQHVRQRKLAEGGLVRALPDPPEGHALVPPSLSEAAEALVRTKGRFRSW